jgi:hypothetical protein
MPETQHGGRRTGSGRKPQGAVAMVNRAYVIRQDQADWIYHAAHIASDGIEHLEYVKSQSEVVRDALDAYIKQAPH